MALVDMRLAMERPKNSVVVAYTNNGGRGNHSHSPIIEHKELLCFRHRAVELLEEIAQQLTSQRNVMNTLRIL